jgi:gliding motility-associated-like protein
VSLLPRILPAVLIIASPNDTICAGEQVTVNAQLSGTGLTATYQWFLNSINTGVTGSTYTSNGLRNGDVLQAVATANGQCLTVNQDTSNIIRIISRPPIVANILQASSVCPGTPATFNVSASGGTGTYYYNWNVSPLDTSSITLVPVDGQEILVAVSDNCTRLAGTDTLTVNLLPGPAADFSYLNPQPGSFNYTLEFNNASVNSSSWLWTFFDENDTAFSTDENPQYTFADQGEYQVLLISQNANGCVDSVRYTVIVREDLAIYVPNAFTPDGDLVNDEFGPVGASIHSFSMTIYSRWGEKIYESRDMSWNGTMKGKPVQQGIYLYRIEAEGEVFVGRVAVVR